VTLHRLLVLGSGGREHALAWRLARDPQRPEVLVGPGSEGAAREYGRVDVREADPSGVVRAARERGVDLVVIGPESALAAGVADALAEAGIAVFGASRAAARLESSKWFAKEVMAEAGVPTARAEVFSDVNGARAALGRFGPPWVLKADGLAAGKGVLVTHDADAARAFLAACLEGARFGEGGRRVVLEEFLPGEEASVMAVCDGERFVLLPAARDYKRALDGDAGPNTGGMGAYAPTPFVTPAVEREVGDRVVRPVLRAMAARGTPFRGALYCGLMLAPGGPRVVEFNARFGDPETQAILPLVDGSFSRLLASAARGALEEEAVSRREGAAATVALVDEGYPDAVRGGGTITGLPARDDDGLAVFHAATRADGDRWTVTGGRAAYVTATARDLEAARTRAYAAVSRLGGSGWRARSDIARARVPVGGS
jgi:phosphoribosylamine--glycine ligase